MNSELLIILLLLAAAIVMFAMNRPRVDAVALHCNGGAAIYRRHHRE